MSVSICTISSTEPASHVEAHGGADCSQQSDIFLQQRGEGEPREPPPTKIFACCHSRATFCRRCDCFVFPVGVSCFWGQQCQALNDTTGKKMNPLTNTRSDAPVWLASTPLLDTPVEAKAAVGRTPLLEAGSASWGAAGVGTSSACPVRRALPMSMGPRSAKALAPATDIKELHLSAQAICNYHLTIGVGDWKVACAASLKQNETCSSSASHSQFCKVLEKRHCAAKEAHIYWQSRGDVNKLAMNE